MGLKVIVSIALVLGLVNLAIGGAAIIYGFLSNEQIALLFYVAMLALLGAYIGVSTEGKRDDKPSNNSQNGPA